MNGLGDCWIVGLDSAAQERGPTTSFGFCSRPARISSKHQYSPNHQNDAGEFSEHPSFWQNFFQQDKN